jgi:hypothetical protein
MPFLSGNCRYMHCHRQSMLHQIYTSWIGNDNIHQGSKTIFGDDNIHSSSCVVREKVKNLFCTWTSFFDVIAAMVSWSVSWVAMCSFSHKQCSKWIPKSSMVWPHLALWKMQNCRMWYIEMKIWDVVRKWAENKQNKGVLGWTNNQALVVGLTHEQRCVT